MSFNRKPPSQWSSEEENEACQQWLTDHTSQIQSKARKLFNEQLQQEEASKNLDPSLQNLYFSSLDLDLSLQDKDLFPIALETEILRNFISRIWTNTPEMFSEFYNQWLQHKQQLETENYLPSSSQPLSPTLFSDRKQDSLSPTPASNTYRQKRKGLE